jgi:hypothetical protein
MNQIALSMDILGGLALVAATAMFLFRPRASSVAGSSGSGITFGRAALADGAVHNQPGVASRSGTSFALPFDAPGAARGYRAVDGSAADALYRDPRAEGAPGGGSHDVDSHESSDSMSDKTGSAVTLISQSFGPRTSVAADNAGAGTMTVATDHEGLVTRRGASLSVEAVGTRSPSEATVFPESGVPATVGGNGVNRENTTRYFVDQGEIDANSRAGVSSVSIDPAIAREPSGTAGKPEAPPRPKVGQLRTEEAQNVQPDLDASGSNSADSSTHCLIGHRFKIVGLHHPERS